MAYRVQVSGKAIADIEQVLVWFQQQLVSQAGDQWFAGIWRAIESLELNPLGCSMAAEAEEVGREIRELLFGSRRGQYRILFEIRGRVVYVLHVRHSARDVIRSDCRGLTGLSSVPSL